MFLKQFIGVFSVLLFSSLSLAQSSDIEVLQPGTYVLAETKDVSPSACGGKVIELNLSDKQAQQIELGPQLVFKTSRIPSTDEMQDELQPQCRAHESNVRLDYRERTELRHEVSLKCPPDKANLENGNRATLTITNNTLTLIMNVKDPGRPLGKFVCVWHLKKQ